MGAKGLMLWVMCSETGKEEEKGETCKCDRDSPASQTWGGLRGSAGNGGALPASASWERDFSCNGAVPLCGVS